MNNSFFDTSKSVANDFLQSIVFIDDRAYPDPDQKERLHENNYHEFDALKITQAFAKSQKICAVYKPRTIEDINDLTVLVKKADITVIDWQINITSETSIENKEEDAEEDDPRGSHTRKIIRGILSDPLTGKGSLKLILVYTGDTDLYNITKEIFDDLTTQNIEGLQIGDCKVFTPNVKILIVAKASTDDENGNKFKHNSELKSKIIKYENLPEFILTEFSEMTSGLLSNFVLQALTVLRNNTFRLVKLYNKDLDPSFVHHRLLLPNQEDSKEQLIEILSSSVQALLNYNQVGNSVSIQNIKSWIDKNTFKESLPLFKNNNIILDNEFLKSWSIDGIDKAITDYWGTKNFGEMSKSVIPNFQTIFHKKGSSLLMDGKESNKQDSEFSILTHHKSNLKQPSNIPKLSLGTIVKQDSKGDSGYFLCIQAKCDSTRVLSERKFLFLPLKISEEDKKFHLVIEENKVFKRLQVVKDAFEIRTIKFKPEAGSENIIASTRDNSFFFISTHNEKLDWICDLKDAHAQRIANTYAYQLSRIGLDESEWLRRWAGN
ncbi:MAG: response regulator receiver domain [Bacteroidota bacterium]|nr:response regulator receiver domain [Bacteroidota bacterium]